MPLEDFYCLKTMGGFLVPGYSFNTLVIDGTFSIILPILSFSWNVTLHSGVHVYVGVFLKFIYSKKKAFYLLICLIKVKKCVVELKPRNANSAKALHFSMLEVNVCLNSHYSLLIIRSDKKLEAQKSTKAD